MWLEFGAHEEHADGQWSSVPLDGQRFTGFQDLRERDAYLLFRQGQVGAWVGASAGWLSLFFGFALIWTIDQVAGKAIERK